MLSGPICAMVWEGRDAVKTGRSTLDPKVELYVLHADMPVFKPFSAPPTLLRPLQEPSEVTSPL